MAEVETLQANPLRLYADALWERYGQTPLGARSALEVGMMVMLSLAFEQPEQMRAVFDGEIAALPDVAATLPGLVAEAQRAMQGIPIGEESAG